MKIKDKSRKLLLLAIIISFISMLGSSLVQSSFGQVTVKDLMWETETGHSMSAHLFIPEGASANNKAPAIVTSHGWYNSREMQDLNNIEYSRRGYVVLSISMYGHGKSDAVTPDEWINNGTGMYDGVRLLADLPYVDTSRIGITGHSNGARAANWAVDVDNTKEEHLISSVLLVANDANYKKEDTEEYYNKYGSRDVGIVAAQFDEFFFRTKQEDGTLTLPQDYIHGSNAQSFLNFGVDPQGKAVKESGTIYRENIEGKEAIRYIVTPYQTHPWNHFSKGVVEDSLLFFDESLGAPNNIENSNQIWQYKQLFNAIGLIGLVLFIISLTGTLIELPLFKKAKSSKKSQAIKSPTGIEWLWIIVPLLISAAFSYFTVIPVFGLARKLLETITIFPQVPTFYIGLWSLISGIFTVIILLITYNLYTKKTGVNLEERGLKLKKEQWTPTILLAVVVVFMTYLLVFIADYLFNTDFRLWVLAVPAFTADKLLIALKYLPFFLVFYIINSISLNVFNDIKFTSKDWVNTLISAFFNGLGALMFVLVQHIGFFAQGELPFGYGTGILSIWLISVTAILMGAAIISRRIYRKTNNPYLGGLIMALIVTLISVSTTLTQI